MSPESPGNPDHIGRRLKHAREARGFTMHELAHRAHVSQGIISAVESGVRHGTNLTLSTAVRLANVLLVSLDWLCGRIGEDGKLCPPLLTLAGEGVGV